MEVGKVKVISSFDDLLEHSAPVEYAEVTLAPGVVARIGSLSGEEWNEWSKIRANETTRRTSGQVLISRSLVDETGRRIGDETKATQLSQGRVAISEMMLRAIFNLNKVFVGNEEVEAKNVSSGTKSN